MRVYIIVAGLVLSIIGRGSATVVDKGTDAQRECELLVQNSFRNQDEARSAGDAANNVVALSVRTPPRTIESRCMSPEVAPLRHPDCIAQCPLSGLTRKTFAHSEFFSVGPEGDMNLALFDRLVSTGEQHWRNFQTESFGGLEVDHQLEPGRLLNR